MLKTLVAVGFMVSPAFISHGAAKPDFSAATEVLRRGIENHAFPGCTVCVGTDEKVLWSEAFGRFDYDHGKAVTRRTIYDLASCTKVTGTTSVYMRLVALGKMDVHDRVEKYLPEFIRAAANEEEKSRRQQITIEHLLTHTGGIASWGPFYKTVHSYREMLEAIYKTPLENPPGKKFAYSDLGMMLLGEIASRAGGKPLPELEQELVFHPLGMKNTMRNPPQKFWSRIPPTEKWPDKEGYVHDVVHDENARAAEGITGHAGLFSTAEDLGKLAAELIRATEGRSKLFPKTVVDDFFRERTFVPHLGRGLGWGIGSTKDAEGNSTPIYIHTGFTGTSIRIDPKRKLFIVLLTNRVHPTRDNEKIGRVRGQLIEPVVKAFDAENTPSK